MGSYGMYKIDTIERNQIEILEMKNKSLNKNSTDGTKKQT